MREQFRSMLAELQAQSQQLIAMFDAHDVLRYANPAFSEAYDVSADGVTRWVDMMRANYAKGCGTAVDDSNFEGWLASALSRRGKTPYRAFEADLCDGRWLWMTETVHNGWMLCVGSDITALMQNKKAPRLGSDKAARAAQPDLLNVSNRNHLLAELDRTLKHAHAKDEPVCVATFDLDYFKRVNDQFGRDAGDSMLYNFVGHLQACTRRGDTCGRIGGEEFMLVLSGVVLSQAQKVIQRLLDNVRQARPLDQWPEQGYTVSAGLAMAHKGEEAKALLLRADEALYGAKGAGRDRLECAF